MTSKIRLVKPLNQIRIEDTSWLDLGALRELVRQADAHGWTDKCLVSHSIGGGDHPSLRGLKTATDLVVEGPS